MCLAVVTLDTQLLVLTGLSCRHGSGAGGCGTVDIRLLGPVELWSAGRQVSLGPRQQRCLLAVLAMNPRQTVSAELLVDRIWGERTPRNVRNALYTNLSRLRGTLASAEGALRRRGDSGYLLDVDDDEIDLHRARRLAADARALADRKSVV